MRYIIIGNDLYFQFPSVSYCAENKYIENLAENLHSNNIDFYCIVPYNSKKQENQYPFKIYYTEEYPTLYTKKSQAKYAIDCRKIIRENYQKGDIILSTGEWSSQFFFDLKIPMIITIFRECEDNILKSQILNWDHIKYRFLTKYHYTGWKEIKWLKNHKLILSPGIEKDNLDIEIDNKYNYYLFIITNSEQYNYLTALFNIINSGIYMNIVSLINCDFEKKITSNSKYLNFYTLDSFNKLDPYIKYAKGCFISSNEYFQHLHFNYIAAKCMQYNTHVISLYESDNVIKEICKSRLYVLNNELTNFTEINDKIGKIDRTIETEPDKFSVKNKLKIL